MGWRKTPDFPKEHVPIEEKQKQTNLGGFSNQPTSQILSDYIIAISYFGTKNASSHLCFRKYIIYVIIYIYKACRIYIIYLHWYTHFLAFPHRLIFFTASGKSGSPTTITPSFLCFQGANTCGSQGQLGHQRWHTIGLFLIKCNHLAFLGDKKLGVLPTLWWANPLPQIIRKGKECMNASK